mgnify:CR=1 FL=1
MTPEPLDVGICPHEMVHDQGKMWGDTISVDIVHCPICEGTLVFHPNGHPARMSRDNYEYIRHAPDHEGKLVPYYKRR